MLHVSTGPVISLAFFLVCRRFSIALSIKSSIGSIIFFRQSELYELINLCNICCYKRSCPYSFLTNSLPYMLHPLVPHLFFPLLNSASLTVPPHVPVHTYLIMSNHLKPSTPVYAHMLQPQIRHHKQLLIF